MPDSNSPPPKKKHVATFTWRAVVIGIFSMLGLAFWVQFHEVLVPKPNILVENSPPSGAVGIFIGILLIGSLVTWLRPKLRLSPGELAVIYAMLITAGPLMTQGMWHRFLGLVIAIPENKSNVELIDHYSEKLWPHGDHLISDRRFNDGLPPGSSVTPKERGKKIEIKKSPVGATTAFELHNPPPADSDAPAPITTLRIHIPREGKKGAQLIPGERYYFSALFRLTNMNSQSSLSMELTSDKGEIIPLFILQRNTLESFSSPGAFTRKSEPMVELPRKLDHYVELVFRLEGAGDAAVTDINFFSNEALARLRKGSLEVRESDLPKLPLNQRDKLVIRPDNLVSFSGICYYLKGYVPWTQWFRPLAYWTSIVMAIFFCLLGLSVIFRRQWADNERFSFPLVALPRMMLEEKQEDGRTIRPLFRKNTFRIGVILAVVYCLAQGLAFYIPGMPDPTPKTAMASYFSSPAMKAMMRGMGGDSFMIHLSFMAIAFFIDLDMLLSFIIFFWVCKIPYALGEWTGWKKIGGSVDNFPFPQEQHIGAFIGLALIAIWVARKHLLGVFRRVLGLTGGIDDSNEAFSYRTAVLLFVGAFIFFGLWGNATGLGVGSSLIFFGFLVVCGLSAARIRTEVGAPATYFTPYNPYLIFFLLGGLKVFGVSTLVLAFVAGGFMAVAQFLMFAPTQVEMQHLGNQVNAKPSGISWGLIIGILGGILLGGYVVLVWCYGHGGDNIPYMKHWGLHQDWYLRPLRRAIGQTNQVQSATAPLIAVGVGTGLTVLLTFLRMQFVGFWLNPIAYVLANSHFGYMCWGSLLAAWAVKTMGLKIGGPQLIRNHMAPLFAGVFCGTILGMLFWDIVGLIAMAHGIREIFTAFP